MSNIFIIYTITTAIKMSRKKKALKTQKILTYEWEYSLYGSINPLVLELNASSDLQKTAF